MVSDLSHETVRQVLGKDQLKPHLRRMWRIPPRQSAAFVAQMEDVLAVYCRPVDPRRPLVCLDEISVQLIGEGRAPCWVRRGRMSRYDNAYVRNGTANLFLAFAPLLGQRVVRVTEQRRRGDFAASSRRSSMSVFRTPSGSCW